MSAVGLLLAAGAGRRMGQPKALVRADDGQTWAARAIGVLRDGGCDDIGVVIGAEADEVTKTLGAQSVSLVEASDWESGLSASLLAGLAWAEASDATAVLVHLVDLPDVSADVVRRILARGDDDQSLARAAYDGTPGHPVLIGRLHWGDIVSSAHGDRGAGPYLAAADCQLVECGDLATGQDKDYANA